MQIRLLPFLFAIRLIVSQNAALHCSDSPLETYLEYIGYGQSNTKEVFLPDRTVVRPETNLILRFIILCFGLFMGVLVITAAGIPPQIPLALPALLFVISLRILNQGDPVALAVQSVKKFRSFILEHIAPKSKKQEWADLHQFIREDPVRFIKFARLKKVIVERLAIHFELKHKAKLTVSDNSGLGIESDTIADMSDMLITRLFKQLYMRQDHFISKSNYTSNKHPDRPTFFEKNHGYPLQPFEEERITLLIQDLYEALEKSIVLDRRGQIIQRYIESAPKLQEALSDYEILLAKSIRQLFCEWYTTLLNKNF